MLNFFVLEDSRNDQHCQRFGQDELVVIVHEMILAKRLNAFTIHENEKFTAQSDKIFLHLLSFSFVLEILFVGEDLTDGKNMGHQDVKEWFEKRPIDNLEIVQTQRRHF